MLKRVERVGERDFQHFTFSPRWEIQYPVLLSESLFNLTAAPPDYHQAIRLPLLRY